MAIRSNKSKTVNSTRRQSNLLTKENITTTQTGAEKDWTIDNILIKAAGYRYPREEDVPAGFYYSVVNGIDTRTKNGKVLIDVSYDIEGIDYKNKGKTFRIKQSYPYGSDFCQEFFDAMVSAGVTDGSSLRKAIGVDECIKLAYVSDTSEIGSIVARKPCVEEDDSDEDDLLPEEENE